MKLKKYGAIAAVALGMGVMSGQASAVLVTEWSWTVTLNWVTADGTDVNGTLYDAPDFTAGGGTQEVTPTILSWGADGGSYTIAPLNRSALVIDPSIASDPPSLFTNGAPVDTVAVTHYNNIISATFATLETATLVTTLSLTPLDPAGAPLGTVATAFTTNFTETLNSAPCGFTDPFATPCSDIFVVNLQDLSFQFVYDGFLYTTLIGANGLQPNLDAFAPGACAEANAAPNCSGIITQEGTTTTIDFNFSISAVPVPEPATLALLGLGLLGLGAASRRRKAA